MSDSILESPLYFGCLNTIGHYVYSLKTKCSVTGNNYISHFLRKNDGLLPPQNNFKDVDGATSLSHPFDLYTCIAFWDKSFDHRPGSNSAFLYYGVMTYEEILEKAQKDWPEIFSRFNFKLFKV